MAEEISGALSVCGHCDADIALVADAAHHGHTLNMLDGQKRLTAFEAQAGSVSGFTCPVCGKVNVLRSESDPRMS